MLRFYSFLLEDAKGTIGHLEHLSDRVFDGKHEANLAHKKLKELTHGHHSMTTKIDDSMSFVAKRDKAGKVAVKYKGKSSPYSSTHDEIEANHPNKPHVTSKLHHLLDHLPKILPHREGEWQGGYMASKDHIHHSHGHVHMTPNTIKYSAPEDSPEGKKLAHSKLSVTMHTELKHGVAHPVDTSDFHKHRDVHVMPHIVGHRDVSTKGVAKIDKHLRQAKTHIKDMNHTALKGHEVHMRTYVNHTIRTDAKPSSTGYHNFLADRFERQKEKLKTPMARHKVDMDKSSTLGHVAQHRHEFDRAFAAHHHMQTAVETLHDELAKHGNGGFHTSMGGKESSGEGYVARGHDRMNKIVKRRGGFSQANFARSAVLRGKK